MKFDVLYARGRELLESDPAKALPLLELGARLFPDEPSLLSNLGEGRLRAGDRAGARKAYEGALALAPWDDTARKGLERSLASEN